MSESLLHEFSEHLAGITSRSVDSNALEQAKLHVLDTIGSYLAGLHSSQGRKLLNFAKNLRVPGMPLDPLQKLFAASSITRSTEMDDIHLESCTTPGSVVVSTALLLSSQASPMDFLFAIIVGYETVTRLGMALRGSEILYEGIWPSYLLAAAGSAAVAGTIWKFDSEKMENALSIALTLSSFASASSHGRGQSRSLVFGVATRNGVLAALASRSGFKGQLNLLEGEWTRRVSKKGMDKTRLLENFGGPFQICRTSFKPFTCGKQSISAVEAFERILEKGVNPKEIETVKVFVPHHYKRMISMPPSWVAFRLAIFAYHRDAMYRANPDVRKVSKKMADFMSKVSIWADPKLERYYSRSWPARVIVKVGNRQYEETVIQALGDPENSLDREQVEHKFRRALVDSTVFETFENMSKLVLDLPGRSSFSSLNKAFNRTLTSRYRI